MLCKKCGNELSTGAKFCYNCGYYVEDEEEETTENSDPDRKLTRKEKKELKKEEKRKAKEERQRLKEERLEAKRKEKEEKLLAKERAKSGENDSSMGQNLYDKKDTGNYNYDDNLILNLKDSPELMDYDEKNAKKNKSTSKAKPKHDESKDEDDESYEIKDKAKYDELLKLTKESSNSSKKSDYTSSDDDMDYSGDYIKPKSMSITDSQAFMQAAKKKKRRRPAPTTVPASTSTFYKTTSVPKSSSSSKGKKGENDLLISIGISVVVFIVIFGLVYGLMNLVTKKKTNPEPTAPVQYTDQTVNISNYSLTVPGKIQYSVSGNNLFLSSENEYEISFNVHDESITRYANDLSILAKDFEKRGYTVTNSEIKYYGGRKFLLYKLFTNGTNKYAYLASVYDDSLAMGMIELDSSVSVDTACETLAGIISSINFN